MKSRTLLTAAVLALAAPLAWSQQEHEAHHPTETPQTGTTESTMQPPMMADKLMQRMEEMHAQLEKMQQVQDPAERQRLMEEHRQAMRETMAKMREMRGGGQGMMGGQGMIGGQGMMGDQDMMQHMTERHQDIEQRLERIEALLQQLVERKE